MTSLLMLLMSMMWVMGVVVGKELGESLLERLERERRGAPNMTSKVTVNITGALYQLVSIEQGINLATVAAYFDLRWEVPLLRWDPEEFGGVTETYLPSKSVWIPELYLYHRYSHLLRTSLAKGSAVLGWKESEWCWVCSLEGSTALSFSDSNLHIRHNGKIRIFLPFTAKAFCPINVKYFPFDNQTCQLRFGSWSYKIETIEYRVGNEELLLTNFYDNQEWMLQKSRIQNEVSNYTSDSGEIESYSTVKLVLEIKRQSFYYICNLVLPTTLVSLVAVIGFHTNTTSQGRRESKYRLGITTLLSMGVMLLMVVDEMPKFALASTPGKMGSFSDVPLLAGGCLVIYYGVLIVTISLGTVTTSVFVALERYALSYPDVQHIPLCLRPLSLACLPLPSLHHAHAPDDDDDDDDPHLHTQGHDKRDRVVRFKAGDQVHDGINGRENSSYSEVHRSLSEGMSFLPIPLHQLRATSPPRSWAKPRKSISVLGAPTEEDLEEFKHHLQKLTDQLGIIAHRMLTISAKIDGVERSRRRRSLLSRAQPILTTHWHRILSRMEFVSFTLYLSVILGMLWLFFNHSWY